MDRIITFDVCSICINLILIFSLIIRKMTKENSNRIFLYLCCVVLLSAIFDIVRILIPAHLVHNKSTYVALKFCTYTYYLFREMTTPVYLLFILAVTGRWYEFKENKKYRLIFYIPTGLILFSLLLNNITSSIFYVTPDLQYHRGKWIFHIYIFYASIMFFATGVLVKNRKMLKNEKFWLLFLMVPISLLGLFIQSMFPRFMVEVFTTSVPLLIISLLVLKPEEVLDFYTGVFNLVACEQTIRQNFLARRPMKIIFFKIENDKDLQYQYGDEAYQLFIQNILKFFYSLGSIMETEVFHLENGIFLIETLEKDEKKLKLYLHELEWFLNNRHKISDSLINIDFLVTVARCPQDFNEYDHILNFGLRFDQIINKKNQITYYSKEASDRFFILQTSLDEIIKKAILKNNFKIYYQPVYSAEKKKFVAAEALIRLIDDRYGFIPPGFFIPVAECSGAIHQIGDFILNDVCRFVSENDLDSLGIEYIDINLSSSQCLEQELIKKITDTTENFHIPHDKLNLEIKDDMPEEDYGEKDFNNANFSDDDDSMIIDKNISELARLGFGLSLDGFGTGHSNFRRMNKLPVDIVKLDKFYVDELHRSGSEKKMEVIIRNTFSTLKKLNKKILIEGIESKDDFNTFVNFGCDYIQGYYFSKALPENDFLNFIRRKNYLR